jgi:uncharacterized repeat protein (TIGR03803 family)
VDTQYARAFFQKEALMKTTCFFLKIRFHAILIVFLILFYPFIGQCTGSNPKILHDFVFGVADGLNPSGDLTRSPDGHTLYGMTQNGGNSGYGTIFSYDLSTNTFQLLHSFIGGANDGSRPQGLLSISTDGHTLYGMTPLGGKSDCGTIFSYNLSTNTFQLLHSFVGGANDGSIPQGSLSISASGSILYGMTQTGGCTGNCSDGVGGGGTIFSFNLSTNTFRLLHSFTGGVDDGNAPFGSLTISTDDHILYGMTNLGGSHSDGTIFSYDTSTNTFHLLHSFGTIISGIYPDGAWPYGSLTLSGDGLFLYGMTSNGSSNGSGAIFKFNLSSNTMQVIHPFAGGVNDGGMPLGSLTLSGDGLNLYGMTGHGGSSGFGTLFKLNLSSNIFQLLHSFIGGAADGKLPNYSSLLLSADGMSLYGMTSNGSSSDNGSIFSYNLSSNSLLVLHGFAGVPADGVWPAGSLTASGNNLSLYGVTPQGGAAGVGTIFQYNPNTNTYILLRSMTLNAAEVYDSLTLSTANNMLYGVSVTGGTSFNGTIFSYAPGTNTLEVLHNFSGGINDGANPYGRLTLSPDGHNLYGMTSAGGNNFNGTIFNYINSTNSFHLLHSFAGGAEDGSRPQGTLTFSADSHTLYGMTTEGGASDFGTIFSYNLTNGYQLLHSFSGGVGDGSVPSGSLTLSADGHTLYGMTENGGSIDGGSIFSYDASTNILKLLHNFTGGAGDGGNPLGDLIRSLDGYTLYGMTNKGGSSDYGTIFSYDTNTNILKLLHSFTGETADGKYPQGSLTLSSDGSTLYGMTMNGGDNNDGVIFSFSILANIPGDINHDSHVDLIDAILALQISAGKTPVQSVFPDADVNGDGKIGVAEAIYAMQKVAGMQ